MGNGMCSRRQKGLLQTGFCVLVVLCFGFGFYTYTHLNESLRSAEVLAQKYKQQQESVSAQLQVVYEHRSRLERSLQKERGEHKKTKEDFLVYKLEAQESLNKEKQDAMNRYGALSSQHKILKNQHDEIKKQLMDLQFQHNNLRLENRKAAETHNQHFLQLHQQKDLELGTLQDTINKLKHESKQLRRAHQDIHQQLTEAQAQVEEFRQLKEALRAMPSFKHSGLNPAVLQEQNQARQEHPWGPDNNRSQATEQKDTKVMAEGLDQTHGVTVEQDHIMLEGEPPDGKQEPPPISEQKLENHENSHQMQANRWDEIINGVNTGADFKLRSRTEQVQIPFVQNHHELQTTAPRVTKRQWSLGHRNANWRVDRASEVTEEEDERTDNELDDVGRNDAERLLLHAKSPRGKQIAQEPLIPDIDEDPAQDPNNQGEDEFEEAEVERPGFTGKAAGLKEQQLLGKSDPEASMLPVRKGMRPWTNIRKIRRPRMRTTEGRWRMTLRILTSFARMPMEIMLGSQMMKAIKKMITESGQGQNSWCELGAVSRSRSEELARQVEELKLLMRLRSCLCGFYICVKP
ncbi:Golgi integral membrane protein 4-like isoform X2 [Scyliorhinus canicula]|uniref:Golgi integral membrane protein 4-like isoform X2 n=1 Tax=Scyliorhinus canicula TaxID=7830 RepID=UPI0018F33258|nr:Golgi integral membrane protein 4-like isoform X2 [Scyliorhinus canicula]